jgi:MFS family permease
MMFERIHHLIDNITSKKSYEIRMSHQGDLLENLELLKLIIDEIYYSVDSLKESSVFMDYFVSQAIVSVHKPKLTDLDYPSVAGIFLNLMSALLYMANYYILTLAAKDYMEVLDMPATWTGYLVMMTPTAAVICGFAYSAWTNISYIGPLAFSATMVTIGNVLYFLAFDFASPGLLFAGRFAVGMGGARAINRRYIADYVSLRARTKWSVAYVACSTLGTAIGPILAGLLLLIDEYTVAGFTVNKLNSPALLMFFVWILFMIALAIWFREPEITRPKPGESSSPHLTCSQLAPTFIVLWTLFYCKILQEAILTSAPLISYDFFGWSGTYTGFYLAILNLLVIPVHLLVGYLSRKFKDRSFILVAVIFATFACVLQINFAEKMPEFQYILANIIIFLATNVTDGTSNSLLSKVLPLSLASGIFNAGFNSTLMGTLGRVVGNALVSFAGSDGIDHIENNLFVPLTGLSGLTLIVLIVWFRRLHYDVKKDK